ncbi:MAG TPA: serpin family protein [Tepidisphaeraceae bacterium]|nr:serpin family protein [Tepidisphaeraceae bacterium]
MLAFPKFDDVPDPAFSHPTATRVLMEPLEPRTLLSAAPSPTPADVVAQADNAFAFDLLQQLDKTQSGNIFFSPYSAATALEMALQGAQGVTASQMIQALHLPSADLADAGIQALYQLFQSSPDAGYTLSTANALWVNSNFPLLQSFIASSQNIFGAGPNTVDFSNPTAAAATINAWVSTQTHGKITNLISPAMLNSYTSLVLTNAIYFSAKWASPFNAGPTQQMPFQISSTEAADASMMYQSSDLEYYQQTGSDGFQALDLPYAGGNLDMLVILPTNTYNLTQFASTLTSQMFAQITSNLTTADVDVLLPKFQINESYDLSLPLQNLGIQAAFNPHKADFNGISQIPSYITDVVQKSFIRVNQSGTQAAAATAVVMAEALAEAFPPQPVFWFDADHPFLFAIRDNATNTILFLGSISDPSNGAADYSTAPTALSPVAPPPVSIISPPAQLPVATESPSIPVVPPGGYSDDAITLPFGADGWSQTASTPLVPSDLLLTTANPFTLTTDLSVLQN